MRTIIKRPLVEGPPDPNEPEPPLRRKLVWFAGLALGGLVSVAGLAYVLRAALL